MLQATRLRRDNMQLTYFQILSVTADNASPNDTMVRVMQRRLRGTSFKGPRTRVRCFAHVLNLVAKTLLVQFDSNTKNKPAKSASEENESSEDDDEGWEDVEDDEDEGDRPNPKAHQGVDDAWVNERDNMTLEECAKHDKAVEPVTGVLWKVSTTRFVNSLSDRCPASKVCQNGHQLLNDPSPEVEDPH